MGQSLGAFVCAFTVGLLVAGNLRADSPSPLPDRGKPLDDPDTPFAGADDPFIDDNLPAENPAQPAIEIRPAEKAQPAAEARPTAEPGPTQENRTAAGGSAGDAARRINGLLDQPLQTPLEFVAAPLNQITQFLAEEYDLPIQFDINALDAVAASPEVEVTANIANVSVRSALDLLLRNSGAEELTHVIDNEVLLITTQEEAERRLEVVVYRVDDLVSPDATRAELERLVEILVESIEHESWMVNGTGEGEINALEPGMLVVAQTQRVHEQLSRLLADLRRTKAAIEQSRGAQETSQAPVTRAIRLRDAATDTPENRKVLEQALRHSVDWNVAGKEVALDDVFLHVLPDRVLVRHTPAVVRQVEEAIHEVTLTTPRASARRAGGRFGGGGF